MDLSFISKQKTKKQDEELKDDQPLEETIQVKQLSSYETLFDSEGAPTIKIREDDILGPILMYVDLDLYTGTWKGSVLLLVPISVQTPTVEFYDSQCNSKFMGSPVKIGQYQQSVFYRYDFSVPLDDSIDKRISYQINGTSETYVFTIPSVNSPWRWTFTTCNGWSSSVSEQKKSELGGNDVLWADMLEKHRINPFNLMIGGGDQIYNDGIWESEIWHEFIHAEKSKRQDLEFTSAMRNYTEEYYFINYVKCFFYAGKFTEALTTIPFSYIIDDHDIFDAWGSYPTYLHTSNIFQEIKNVAFKNFLLFQAHTNHEMSREHGYFGHKGYNTIKNIGPYVSLVSIDTRFERSLERIVSEETYNQIFDKLEDMPPSTRHLFVLMGIPIIYPRLTYVEEAMGFLSRSSLIKMNIFQKEGAFSKLLNDFGEPELLDDLNDHWTAGCHLEERKALVLRLQELSNRRKVRVTFVAGDVHCCGVGCFKQSNSEIPEVQDFRYMPQIISSAIVNSPPPNVVIRLLHLSSKKYTLDNFTYEKMVDLFVKDVNGKNPPNNNKKLLGRRNYASFEQISDSQNILVKINVQNETNNGTVPYEYKIAPLQLGNVI